MGGRYDLYSEVRNIARWYTAVRVRVRTKGG